MSICLACNATNNSGASFCAQCGKKLKIQDRYRAHALLGQGAFGKTLLAQDEGKPSHPKCVIKQFIYNDPATRSKALELFDEEAKRLEDLGQHPQIPELMAHCQQDGHSYLVQQFIDGDNLNQELMQQGAFGEQQIRDVLQQLLPVLEFIHKKNVIHRDIKPENIMRRHSDNQLILVDFGAAKHATATTLAKTGTTIGSASYAAPEQARGRAVFASDLYGLGVTCLHLLTGVDPFTLIDDSTLGFAWRDFLSGKRVSDELGKILDKMTQQRPIDRYSSATEALQALGIRSIPSSSTPASLSPTSVRTPPTTGETFQPSQSQKMSARSFTESLKKKGIFGGDVSLEMIAIPSGSYKMGGTHQVSISAFAIGKYQITQALYEDVMGNNPSHFKGVDLPVERVSWNDAVAFCQKLSQQTGKEYRLPSEAEWEYACRAGSTTKYCFGDSDSQLKDYAWYDNSGSKTHPVGKKKPNAWGLYDMHGNVWEWCADNWESDLSKIPKDGKVLLSGGNSSSHPLRGGSWYYNSLNCRSEFRCYSSAGYKSSDLGFRVVCVGA